MKGPGARRVRLRWATSCAVAALSFLAAACGSSLFATTTGTETPVSTSTTTTTTSVPAVNGVAVGIPAAGCSAAIPTSDQASGGPQTAGTAANDGGGEDDGGVGADQGGPSEPTTTDGWRPSFVLAPVPTALVSQVEFYSDGAHTVLAPSSWTCGTFSPADGETELVVYPDGDPDPPLTPTPPPGSQGVFAVFASTGEPQGVSLVCPFFTVPVWQEREAQCSSDHTPAGEQTTMATPDVAAVTDPSGVIGSLPGSGGQHSVQGVVIFPQVQPAVQHGDALAVAEVSCSLPTATLCPAILSDFEVREFPVPATRSD